MSVKSFSNSKAIRACISLLQMLSSAPHQRVQLQSICDILHITPQELSAVIGLIGELSDPTSGARAVVAREDDTVVLYGDAAQLMPLRLSLEEASAIACVLDVVAIDSATYQRIRAALLPFDFTDAHHHIAYNDPYTLQRQQLLEAIEDGVRLNIVYQSLNDISAHPRLIDPIDVCEEGGFSYLLAWDVAQDAQRRYRLDRIEHIEFTDDSVVLHAVEHQSMTESLQKTGETVRILVYSSELLQQLSWSGITKVTARKEGITELEVACTSRAWLLDQILAYGGELEIVEPLDLREELICRGKLLLAHNT